MAQMDIENFREWLSRKYKGANVISTRIANCKRVEKYEGDLDKHYAKDGGKGLLEKLTLSKHDSLPNHKIPIDGDIYYGTATLKQATKLYFAFMAETKRK